jgi:hypothetical protein
MFQQSAQIRKEHNGRKLEEQNMAYFLFRMLMFIRTGWNRLENERYKKGYVDESTVQRYRRSLYKLQKNSSIKSTNRESTDAKTWAVQT